MQRQARIENGWVRCGRCGHKLGRLVGEKSPAGIEIKCSSCKEINVVEEEKDEKNI